MDFLERQRIHACCLSRQSIDALRFETGPTTLFDWEMVNSCNLSGELRTTRLMKNGLKYSVQLNLNINIKDQ